MTRTNFTKVEEALNEGLRKLTVEHLLHLTERGGKKEELTREQVAIIVTLEAERLYQKDNCIYQKIGIRSKDLKDVLSKPQELEDKEWEKILIIREKITNLAKEIDEKFPKATDEELVENERHKHINKRFNVNEKWLPLK